MMKHMIDDIDEWRKYRFKKFGKEALTAGLQAIAEVEKQEPVAIGEEWKPCVKLPIVVHVREQRKGETHVSTREGITPVKEDDLIMRGVAGEEYPIGRELFHRTYTFDTAQPKREPLTDEQKDASRYRWLRDNNASFTWIPSKYNEKTVSGFSAFGTGYLGFEFEAAVDLAIEAKLKEKNT